MSTKYVITKHKDRLFTAVFKDDKCVELHPSQDSSEVAGNIYIGRVENVVKNINSAFVEIQKGVKCYYSLDENKRHFFLNKKNNTSVNQGDLLLLQISKEPIKTKPATVTGKITLTGRFLVLSSDVSGVSISSKTKSNDNCRYLKSVLCEKINFDALDGYEYLSDNQKDFGRFGFILRTNSAKAEEKEVLAEALKLMDDFRDILKKSLFASAFTHVYKAPPGYIEFLKNAKFSEECEFVTDLEDVYETLAEEIAGDKRVNLRLYKDDLLSLSKLYSLESIISNAMCRKLWLKSGGYIIIEQTEALTVIDVNSGKYVANTRKKSDKEKTYVLVNKEAAVEIARQLRLRNISGIIVVDFINMTDKSDNSEFITYLKQLLKQDETDTAFVDITKLGLVEITRKRSGKPLIELL